MTKEKLKPIDVSKYTVTESGNVIKDVKDKLKQEAEEKLPQVELDYCHGFMNPCEPKDLLYSELLRFETGYKRGYLAGAEPREKRIAELEEKLKHAEENCINKTCVVFKDKEDCVAKLLELEAQIEKMKNCRNCKKFMIEGVCGHFLQVGWCKNWELRS